MNSIQIFEKHLTAFKAGQIKINSENPKFKDKNEVKTFLEGGGIIPALFNEAVIHSVSMTEQMFLYTLNSFSSERIEKKLKTAFVKALKQIGIDQI